MATCMRPAAPRGRLQKRLGVPPQAEVWYPAPQEGSPQSRLHGPHHRVIPAWKAGGLEHMRCQPKLSKRTCPSFLFSPPTS